MAVRLGAVSYLNTRPLVEGLEGQGDRFTLRYDVPARCAELLHAGEVDLGLIPSIEYPGHDYRIVPGVSIASLGAVASVAIYTAQPLDRIRSVALDTSSRTSVALVRVLCAHWFGIAPELVQAEPDLEGMLARCDAALVIGDNALFLDHQRLGLSKLDLGDEWLKMTGLPFVYAFWAGRPGAIDSAAVGALQEARDRGLAAIPAIARSVAPDDPERRATVEHYFRENVKYALGGPEVEGLRRFYRLASGLGLMTGDAEPHFY